MKLFANASWFPFLEDPFLYNSGVCVLTSQDMKDRPKPKNYLDILEDFFAEKEITKQEYSELKEKYEYNLQRHSQDAFN